MAALYSSCCCLFKQASPPSSSIPFYKASSPPSRRSPINPVVFLPFSSCCCYQYHYKSPYSIRSSQAAVTLSSPVCCRCRKKKKKKLALNLMERSSPRLRKNIVTSHHLRYVESMLNLPSGAGKIQRLNAVILGEALASEEDDLVLPSEVFSQQAHISSPEKYLEMYRRSIEDPAGFWSDIASEFYWKEKWGKQVYSESLDVRKGSVSIEWFKGGVTNICYNALDRNIEAGNGGNIAIYWEGNELGNDGSLTYTELLEKVCQLANYLKDIGVGKGDAVVIYLPMLMELPIAMLACARIGAVHSVVFAGFSAESLGQRIIDCKPKAVITCNAVRRGPKVINLKDIVDAALAESAKNRVSVAVKETGWIGQLIMAGQAE